MIACVLNFKNWFLESFFFHLIHFSLKFLQSKNLPYKTRLTRFKTVSQMNANNFLADLCDVAEKVQYSGGEEEESNQNSVDY